MESPELWLTNGFKLLGEIISQSKQKNVTQIVVVCGDHDFQKSQLLEKLNLSVASKMVYTFSDLVLGFS